MSTVSECTASAQHVARLELVLDGERWTVRRRPPAFRNCRTWSLRSGDKHVSVSKYKGCFGCSSCPDGSSPCIHARGLVAVGLASGRKAVLHV